MHLGFLLFLLAILTIWGVLHLARRKSLHIWFWDYIWHKPKLPQGKKHLVLAFVDHFEPKYMNPSLELERARVDRWLTKYPEMAKDFKDSDGVHPQHTFFYPEEEYEQEHLDKLSTICRNGFGEIEVHLHHHNDTEKGLREKINRFMSILHKDHDAAPLCPTSGKPVFAFIHGNWCLDNSSPDGSWCGVNNELVVLNDLGCYADFTFPSAPNHTQPSKINSIYYATDDPEKPKSHNTGVDVEVGGKESGHLMIIQGALGINWGWRKWGIFPKLENSDVRAVSPTLKSRVDFWINRHIHVKGRPEWIFVKLHTHGTQERDEDALLGRPIAEMYRYLQTKYRDELGWGIHYTSAREMYNIIKAAEAGKSGNPNDYRNFLIQKPRYRTREERAAQM